MEVVCQGPVTVPDNSTLKRHACNAYNGPIFTNLPKRGQRVEVTGRYMLDSVEEGPGNLGMLSYIQYMI
jgi:hypothetical protein